MVILGAVAAEAVDRVWNNSLLLIFLFFHLQNFKESIHAVYAVNSCVSLCNTLVKTVTNERTSTHYEHFERVKYRR